MRTRTPLYGLLLGLFLLGAGLLLPGPWTTSASAAENGTWGVFPTPAAGAAMTDRAYFFHQGTAGTTVSDSVTILNSSTKDLTFQVFATDAMNTPVGGAFALLPAETKPKDVGGWLHLPAGTSTLTVPAKGRKDIPFTVKVPEDATPGDHVGGIVALNTEVEGVQQQGKVQVGVKRSVGARLYFRVPGPLSPGLSVEDVRVQRDAPVLPWVHSAPATITYALVNRGNVVVEPKVTVSAEGLFGRGVLDRPARDAKVSLLPGQRIELTEKWADSPQLDWVTVKVTAGAAAYPDLTGSGGAEFLAVPWPAAGTVLVLLGAGTALWALRRRRRTGGELLPPVRDLAETC
ncbi:DUF916 domain-containing protein [Streptomyces sp. G-G2]|uniref:WxL protein peptidoglycan domain-containing protein n=1 Tax=Streptomyces sp. G-G2 TaxID=3046201 RepID=UPI0024B9ABAC|nr:DUF916 domain-containing protein [Streptomyces sp. G-G2]MDJ0379759.1 DUF916 domain-containing protein [Streptomyces sp. G-G2]